MEALRDIFIILMAIWAIASIIMPFAIMRIRRESIETNRILRIIAAGIGEDVTRKAETTTDTKGRLVKICPNCKATNTDTATACSRCGDPIPEILGE